MSQGFCAFPRSHTCEFNLYRSPWLVNSTRNLHNSPQVQNGSTLLIISRRERRKSSINPGPTKLPSLTRQGSQPSIRVYNVDLRSPGNLLVRCTRPKTDTQPTKHTGVPHREYANEGKEGRKKLSPRFGQCLASLSSTPFYDSFVFFFSSSPLAQPLDWLWAAFRSCVNPLRGPHTNLLDRLLLFFYPHQQNRFSSSSSSSSIAS